jgi:hypothetical protein
MPISPLRLIKNATEYVPKVHYKEIPLRCRGIYVLYKRNRRTSSMQVVYIGMAAKQNAGIRRRIETHLKSKSGQWSHFSVFQVWDNIQEQEVAELEGLFRHIYRHDLRANKLNKLRSFKRINRLRSAWFDEWD